jgi:glycosyltransferase involved in cell wall biosynthesis
MEDALISLCIPLYNGEKYLEQCLNSAINQTYKNIEILLVDDASTDTTWSIAKNYAANDKRIKLHRNDKNIGLVANFNKCLELANGEWLKLLLQDDYLTDNCIETMVAGLSEKDVIAVCKRTFLLDKDADETKRNYYNKKVATFERWGFKSKDAVNIEPIVISTMAVAYICRNFIGEPTSIMLKKDVLNDRGFFNPDIAQICDLEYFVRIASKFGIKYIPIPLTYFRIHKDSTTETNLNDKAYTLSHLDPIITVHQYLYDKSYLIFRGNLSILENVILRSFFRVRVYEAYKSATDAVSLSKFELIAAKYPRIERYKNGSFLIRLLLKLVEARRQARK